VHDTVNIESVGVPMVDVASTEFIAAGAAQAASLGADPAAVFVPHPIQDRTDDELRALADAALHDVIAAIVASGD
jgi:hypothetical protein